MENLYQCTGLRNKNFEQINVGDKVGLYVDCKINKDGCLVDIMINEMYVKLPLNEKGLFYGVSKILKEDKNIKKLLKLKNLTKYFRRLRNDK
jgi:hypothetical protein